MMRLLLLSNGTAAGRPYLAHALTWIADHFKTSTVNRQTIIFIPYALHDYAQYSARAELALQTLNIRLISAHTCKNVVRDLNIVDGILVGGGNTFRLLKALQDLNLVDAIAQKTRMGLPYLGISAGTNIAAPTIKTTNDMPIVYPKKLDSLALLPFQINPHYIDGSLYWRENNVEIAYNGETRSMRLAEFHEENAVPVLALREGTALRVVGSDLQVLGDKPAVLFRRGESSAEIAGTFGLDSVR